MSRQPECDEPSTQTNPLTADCDRCCGLCCVAPAFAASSDFAIEKDAGIPCPNLTAGFRCSIHDRLRAEGFPGCVAYDCFGAGQKVTQITFEGHDWQHTTSATAGMFAVFTIMRQLHELLVYLTEALTLPPARPLRRELRLKLDQIEHLARQSPESLLELDVIAQRREVSILLLQVSKLVRR